MYKVLLALLMAKFTQARKDGLQQLARSMALQISNETEAEALVEKMEAEQVTNFIKDYRREVDSEISKSTKTYEDTMKSKYDLVEKKSQNSEAGDISELIADAVKLAIKPLQEELTQLKSGHIVDTRKQTLQAKLKDAPEPFKNTVLKHFQKMDFKNDEDFNDFLSETEDDLKVFEQEVANSGLGSFPRPNSSTQKRVKEQIKSDIEKWADKNKE